MSVADQAAKEDQIVAVLSSNSAFFKVSNVSFQHCNDTYDTSSIMAIAQDSHVTRAPPGSVLVPPRSI